jgi:hypothetical protein
MCLCLILKRCCARDRYAATISSARCSRSSSVFHGAHQVLSITGHIEDMHNKVSVEDRSADAGDDYSEFSRGS